MSVSHGWPLKELLIPSIPTVSGKVFNIRYIKPLPSTDAYPTICVWSRRFLSEQFLQKTCDVGVWLVILHPDNVKTQTVLSFRFTNFLEGATKQEIILSITLFIMYTLDANIVPMGERLTWLWSKIHKIFTVSLRR